MTISQDSTCVRYRNKCRIENNVKITGYNVTSLHFFQLKIIGFRHFYHVMVNVMSSNIDRGD